MNSETLEATRTQYQAGRAAFERGSYRQAVEYLEKASALANRNSFLGGEIQTWLVTAYEAAGQRTEAIALCQQISQHPHYEIRKQGRRLLYILEAPKLNTRPEWLSQIPDLTAIEPGTSSPSTAAAGAPKPRQPRRTDATEIELPEPEPQSRDNRFLWAALLLMGLIVGGLAWLS